MHKKANIIFDFNRTLYDPSQQDMVFGALDLLEKLSSNYSLYLVSYQNINRDSMIDSLDIRKFFDAVHIIPEKTHKIFDEIITNKDFVTYVVGDTLTSEIQIGKDLGYTTIWLQLNNEDAVQLNNINPDFVIKNITELLTILKNS